MARASERLRASDSCGHWQGLAEERGYLGAEELDGVHHFGVGDGGDGHLEGDAGDAAEDLVDVEDLVGDGFGVADDEGAARGRGRRRTGARVVGGQPRSLPILVKASA